MQIMQHRIIQILLLGFFTTNASSKEFMAFNQIDIEIGNVGSDDDIRIKICDISKCCTIRLVKKPKMSKKNFAHSKVGSVGS